MGRNCDLFGRRSLYDNDVRDVEFKQSGREYKQPQYVTDHEYVNVYQEVHQGDSLSVIWGLIPSSVCFCEHVYCRRCSDNTVSVE